MGDWKTYLNPKPEDHGADGLLKIGFPGVFEKDNVDSIETWTASGHAINPDTNSGKTIGIAATPMSAHRSIRTTAADLLQKAPPNLGVLTNAQVWKVLFSGSFPPTAVGIETVTGSQCFTSNEVVLSAGALDTPKLLRLSGIGPAVHLEAHSIPLLHSSRAVGRNLRDHFHTAPVWVRAEHTTTKHTYYASPDLQAAARKQWQTDQTGPLSEICCMSSIGFFKSHAALASPEFAALPSERKSHIARPGVPSYEVLLNGAVADYFVTPDISLPLAAVYVFVMNTQSTSSVTLASKDPMMPAVFDPMSFSHSYDRRVAVEAMREVTKVTQGEPFKKDTVRMLHGPASKNDEDILVWCRGNTSSSSPLCATCKMGKEGDEERVVDMDFKVVGTQSLRVVDMSVVPILPNNHTQTTAYLVGVMAGDQLVKEYGLDA